MPELGKGFTYLTATGTIRTRKCNLVGAWVITSSGGAGIATIYNGIDTNGPVIIPLSAPANSIGPLTPPKPLLCEYGIHVVLGTHVTGVLIEVEPL